MIYWESVGKRAERLFRLFPKTVGATHSFVRASWKMAAARRGKPYSLVDWAGEGLKISERM